MSRNPKELKKSLGALRRARGRTARVKDAMSRPVRSGTAPVIELAPLARLLVRPELAALGSAYVDPTPPPSVLESDYDITISKKTTLKGTFHDKTPPIIEAIVGEIRRVATP